MSGIVEKKTSQFRTCAILAITFSGLWAARVQAQQVWKPQNSGSTASLRGLSAVDANICWASGAVGTVLRTTDGGKNWQPLPLEQSPAVESGEAGFAASGTNLMAIGKHELMIALGGSGPDTNPATSRVVATQDGGKTWEFHSVPIARNPSSGMFSIARIDEEHWVAVGGNYKRADESSENFVTSSDGGQTWKNPAGRAPSGYRSVVAVGNHNSGKFLLAAGPSGTDLSNDFGQSWRRVSDTGFHTVDFSADLSSGWGAGSDGRISKWIGPQVK